MHTRGKSTVTKNDSVTESPKLNTLVVDHRIVICCGSGGVGKTTTAAVIALEGARMGKRSVVVTIDPAKRLADTLGISELSNTPHLIDGDWPGELWAMMLDTKSTFDNLVAKHAGGTEQAARILENPFYRNISGALSGTQEYMAGEKLYELHEEGGFDLIVVDTPPTRNALDFLDASGRLAGFLDHRLFRMLMAPTRGYMRAVNVAAQALLRTVGKIIGGEVLDDVIAFFNTFEGMEQGFKERAQRVQELLVDKNTAYVLVASPRQDTVEEAAFFANKLRKTHIPVEALVINRMHPRFNEGLAESARQRAKTLAGTDLGDLFTNLADFQIMADGEETHLQGLAAQVTPAPVIKVPFLASDVHDLHTLGQISRHLFA